MVAALALGEQENDNYGTCEYYGTREYGTREYGVAREYGTYEYGTREYGTREYGVACEYGTCEYAEMCEYDCSEPHPQNAVKTGHFAWPLRKLPQHGSSTPEPPITCTMAHGTSSGTTPVYCIPST